MLLLLEKKNIEKENNEFLCRDIFYDLHRVNAAAWLVLKILSQGTLVIFSMNVFIIPPINL